MRLIPAVDLKNGQCVRLYQGDFDKATLYSDDPVDVAGRFSALAVDDLHIVDLDGARSSIPANRSAVAAIVAQSRLRVQVGGGIRAREHVVEWLNAGVASCVVGSIAISDPETVNGWIGEFGVEAIVLALDIRLDASRQPMLTTHGWTRSSQLSLWQCLDAYADHINHHVLCTDVDRDGAMSGPNVALYEEILVRYPELRLQASGGVRNIADLQALRQLGIPAAITGRALLDGAISEREVASFRQSA